MARILVTGTGRAGTQYTARLLSHVGFNATHEKIYRHDFTPSSDWGNVRAESSWLAGAFLPFLPSDVIVWHQLRDPLKVVRCWAEHRLLTDGEHHQPPTPVPAFIHRHLPETSQGNDLERAVAYVSGWNKKIEAWGEANRGRFMRYRVEDLDSNRFWSILFMSGVKVSGDVCDDALASVPKGLGGCRHDPATDLRWKSVRAVYGGESLAEQAERWGYAVN